MKLFSYIKNNKTNYILQFGFGRIGMVIQSKLGLLPGFKSLLSFKMDWNNLPDFESHLAKTISYLSCTNEEEFNLTILWSAGKAGFSATEKDLEKEKTKFIKIIEGLANKLESGKYFNQFIFLSSAGGIYEGNQYTEIISNINPLRPYAFYKLFQEDYLNTIFNGKTLSLRPTSVYSIKPLGGRLGLLNQIKYNIKQNVPTQIYAGQNTLRDYVSAEDIALYISKKILVSEFQQRVELLISGKPTSIFEIISNIEKTLNRRVDVSYAFDKYNDKSFTFSSALKAQGFFPSALTYNIQQIFSSYYG